MYFASIDAHLHYLTVAVLDKSAGLIMEQTIPAEPGPLREAFAPYRPLRLVVETSPFWPWIYDTLVPAGIDFRLAHAKELRAIAQAAQKNDSVDARLLARMLHSDLIPYAYARTPEQRELLRLLRHRVALVRHRTALAARIHSQLHQSQLALPREKLLQRSGRVWLRETAWPRLEREQKRIVRTHLKLIDLYTHEIRVLDRFIAQRGSEWDVVTLLRTVPGIGSFWGLLLAAELLPISRFTSQAKFVSYTGLAPITRSSGGHTRYGSVPKGANRWVRWALVSAVAKHVQCASESPITQFYNRQKTRLGWKKARVAAARKLGNVVYRMLQEQQPWRP